MEHRIAIRLSCEYNENLMKKINRFCESIADECLELDMNHNGSRTEFKSRGEE